MDVHAAVGPAAQSSDFKPKDLTPNSVRYDEDSFANHNKSDLEVTPEIGDVHVNTKIMLPKGGTMVNVRMTKCKRNNEGNVIGRAYDNPILDTRS